MHGQEHIAATCVASDRELNSPASPQMIPARLTRLLLALALTLPGRYKGAAATLHSCLRAIGNHPLPGICRCVWSPPVCPAPRSAHAGAAGVTGSLVNSSYEGSAEPTALDLCFSRTRCLSMSSPIGELRSTRATQNSPVCWGWRMEKKESKTWGDY